MKRIILAAAFLVFYLLTGAQEKPNIVLINFDDMGYGDTEPFGMTDISTPNFNKVAQQGLRLTHFIAAQPVCSASRTALLTGCYSNRLGISGALLPETKIALNPEEETLASILKKAGYNTAMLGKWHMGNKPPYFPTHYGFDSFTGLPYSNDIWPIGYDGKPITDPNNGRGSWPPLTLYENDKPIDTIANLEDQSKLTTLYTEKAVNFIAENNNKPFFLYLAHAMPHVPLAVSDKFKGKSALGLFGDVIMELDWSVGQILDALDKAGVSRNTILILMSDNGSWKSFGNHAGSTGGMREGKNTTWDGGNRVPCIVRWPGKIEAGTVNSSLMANFDILPTIAAATGADLPAKVIDGKNFLPLWLGKTNKSPREVFYYYFGHGTHSNLEAVLYKNWKLVLPHLTNTFGGFQGKDGYPSSTQKMNVPMSLYNIALDPGEDYDVKELYPEIVSQIMKIADEARQDLGDELTNTKGQNVRLPASL